MTLLLTDAGRHGASSLRAADVVRGLATDLCEGVDVQAAEFTRLQAAKARAFELGHRLLTTSVEGKRPFTHKAFAGRATREVKTGRFLAYGTSEAGAAERGAHVLEGVVERGEAWPREPSGT